jgi:membrane associated rhomboid family serine protease
MSKWDAPSAQMSLPRPGKALGSVLAALFFLWLMFAVAINWGGASEELFTLLCGNSEKILQGEVWRLFTAPFMHYPSGEIRHILWALLGLYFLGPALEERWGGARLLRFLFFSALIAYGFQLLLGLLLPASASAKLVPTHWFGAFPVVEAVAIAWALSFRGQTVRLLFFIPVSAMTMVAVIVVLSTLRVIALASMPEGLLSPFGGMFAGWLLGASTPSPLRRFYLKLRMQQLERDAVKGRQRRVKNAPFEVIEGGRSKKEPRGPDGGWLN